MNSNPDPLKKDPIGAPGARQARTYAEFLEHVRGCAVVVDDILKRFPETRAKHEDLIKRLRLDCPGAPWASESICRAARKIQNDWGQYRPDVATQAIRDGAEENWRRWAVEETLPPLPTTEPDENAETEANTAWADVCRRFQQYQATFSGKEALAKIVPSLEFYRQRFGVEDAAILEHALGEAACSANEEK